MCGFFPHKTQFTFQNTASNNPRAPSPAPVARCRLAFSVFLSFRYMKKFTNAKAILRLVSTREMIQDASYYSISVVKHTQRLGVLPKMTNLYYAEP